MAAYRVDSEVFARLPEACFGVVVARGARQPEPGSLAAEVDYCFGVDIIHKEQA